MKVVVIGGTGLIGSKVVSKLNAHGHEAVAASPNTGVDTVTGEGLASGGARGRDVRAVRSLGGRRCAGGCRRAGESGLRGGEFLFRGVSGESRELKDDGEHHGRGSRARSEKVVAFAPLLLLPSQLALCLHLLDPPLRFAGIA